MPLVLFGFVLLVGALSFGGGGRMLRRRRRKRAPREGEAGKT